MQVTSDVFSELIDVNSEANWEITVKSEYYDVFDRFIYLFNSYHIKYFLFSYFGINLAEHRVCFFS